MNKILLTAAVLMLGACGFHLKGQSGALHTPAYKNWHIEGGQALQFPLETALHQASVRVTDTGGAPMTLRINNISQRKETYTITRAAAINEYLLVLTVEAQVLKHGEPVGRPMTVSVRRILDYSDNEILGKQEEEETLWAEMRQDAAEQIVRRLTFLKAE